MGNLSKEIFGKKRQPGVLHDRGYTNYHVNEKTEMSPELMCRTLWSVRCGPLDRIGAMRSCVRSYEQVHNDTEDICSIGDAS